MSTSLGMPQVRGQGNLFENHPFPEVAEHEMGNIQMRIQSAARHADDPR